MKTGTIFDVKRFAVHDGNGLRTTLFLKGCPLRCPWCQNPEGLSAKPFMWYAPTDCLHCETCVHTCPQGAIRFEDGRIHMDREACVMCGSCERACPSGAIMVKGRQVDAREAAGLLLRDKVFFGENGGVTISGGEVLSQWAFAAEVFSLVKEQGVDTAIESCLLAPREALQAMLPVTDHFIIDIKILDGEKHRQIIGADNGQILANFRYLYEQGADLLVRTPLIPGYTADEENIRSIARYLAQTDPAIRYELLNYNPLCRSKYEALEWTYPVESSKPLTAEEMAVFYGILEEEGLQQIVRE